jgi:hypothetical protein
MVSGFPFYFSCSSSFLTSVHILESFILHIYLAQKEWGWDQVKNIMSTRNIGICKYLSIQVPPKKPKLFKLKGRFLRLDLKINKKALVSDYTPEFSPWILGSCSFFIGYDHRIKKIHSKRTEVSWLKIIWALTLKKMVSLVTVAGMPSVL